MCASAPWGPRPRGDFMGSGKGFFSCAHGRTLKASRSSHFGPTKTKGLTTIRSRGAFSFACAGGKNSRVKAMEHIMPWGRPLTPWRPSWLDSSFLFRTPLSSCSGSCRRSPKHTVGVGFQNSLLPALGFWEPPAFRLTLKDR
jgi:hypothetical protein